MPFWHTTPSSLPLSISNRYPNKPFSALVKPAPAWPTPPATTPSAPRPRGIQRDMWTISGLLTRSRTARVSFAMRSRSTNRLVFSDGCCFTPPFMQPRPLLSISFPRAEPRFTIQRPGKPAPLLAQTERGALATLARPHLHHPAVLGGNNAKTTILGPAGLHE